MLRQIVIVRYNNSNSLPLLMPEEKTFLYQNLHAQIANATWGLLHRDNPIYQTSLQKTIDWLQQYFVNDATTAQIIQQLQTLQKNNLQNPTLNLSATLQLFEGI